VVVDLLAEVDKRMLDKYVNKLLKFDTKDQNVYNAHVQKLLKHSVGSHLMEKIIKVFSK